ncbi:MAG: signal peptide peptidase SppA [Bacteroidaceae bacterium]|nr:signal peptide peptidase SppA [Bacteroidaceae bacterium]
MKSFLKYTLATMLGLLLFSIVAGIISIISFAGMIASENLGAPIKDKSVMRINLNGGMEEQGQSNPLAMLTGGEQESLGLDILLEAIDRAKTNDKVLGIYLHGGIVEATPAMLQELRQALVDFKKSGKFIYSYADAYNQGGYYVCSVADSLLLNPSGTVDWHGMASVPIFFKDVMEKVGVKMQVFKVGTYKSAVEPYTSTAMSDANREQVTSYITSIWENMLKDVSASRKVKTEDLNAYADSFAMFQPRTNLLKWKMVDKTVYIDEVQTLLKNKLELGEDDDIKFVTPNDVATAENPDIKDSDNSIAVYYAYGDIVVDPATGGMNMNKHCIASSQMTQDLRDLRENDDVKAVVIRVNSGGGSAYASEQIWREIELLKEKKPVVISMGGMAASGGYYISSGANLIYAEPTTLTGSIGIFGMIPDASELITQKIGVKFDVVKTNALSDFGNQGRSMNADECRLLQAEIERGYEIFTGRVAQGRKMKLDDVKAIAEGRVWTGQQALDRKLVDKLGNLQDAIKAAAKLAKLTDYNTDAYPAPAAWYENLLNNKKSDYLDTQLRGVLGEYYTTFSLLRTINQQDRIQARLPFDLNLQ